MPSERFIDLESHATTWRIVERAAGSEASNVSYSLEVQRCDYYGNRYWAPAPVCMGDEEQRFLAAVFKKLADKEAGGEK